MVNLEIKNTLDKYVQEVHALGNGNFGLRDGFIVPHLWITTSYPMSGDLVVRNDKLRDGWDCGRTAFRVGEELREKGFEVKYKFTRSNEGSVQNYVEVLDPDTKQWVQVDATPWYERLNPGHKEAGEHQAPTKESYAKAILTTRGGPMLSVEKQADSLFIETYLLGGYTSQGGRFDELTDLVNGRSKPSDTKNPQYSLRLWSKLCKSVVDKTIDRVDVSVDILDSRRIWEYKEKMHDREFIEKPEETLEMLARDGVIRLRIEDYGKFLSNMASAMLKTDTPKMGRESIGYLDVIAGHSPDRQNIVRNIRANLGALTNMIFHLYPSIDTADGNYSVHVDIGMTSIN